MTRWFLIIFLLSAALALGVLTFAERSTIGGQLIDPAFVAVVAAFSAALVRERGGRLWATARPGVTHDGSGLRPLGLEPRGGTA